MKITKQPRCQGELLPPWYYGYSYYQYDKMIGMYHVIPFNYVIRFLRILNHWWDRLRSKPSWFDIQIMKIRQEQKALYEKQFVSRMESRIEALKISIRKDIVKETENNFNQYIKDRDKKLKENETNDR